MTDFKNQSGIINIENYDYLTIGVVGCGAIGSWCATAINKLGFEKLVLIDDDTIEKHNIHTQNFKSTEVQSYKASCLSIKLDGDIEGHNRKIKKDSFIDTDVVFICVDSLKERKIIMKAILDNYAEHQRPRLVIDGRMHGLVFRVLTIPIENDKIVEQYTKGLQTKEFTGECTQKGIIQNVFGIVSVMVEQFKKVLNGEDYYSIINADLNTYQFVKQCEIKNG